MKILHFGAGKIGRGLVYPIFRENVDITLVDSNVNLVQSIIINNGYNIIEKDNNTTTVVNIVNPRIISYFDLDNNYDWNVITTSVIPDHLSEIVPKIKNICNNNKKPLFIIPMENSSQAKEIFKSELLNAGGDLDKVYFLGSVIDRIIPYVDNEVNIICEKYCSILIENSFGISKLLNDSNLLTDEIEKEYDKKLLLVNGLHACAAYLGYLKKYEYIHEVISDNNLLEKIKNIGDCYIQYLICNYHFDKASLVNYMNNNIYRFSNSAINDPISRVGRNLILKMSSNERICRPLIFNKKNGLRYEPLEEVVKATKQFKIGNDYKEYIRGIVNI